MDTFLTPIWTLIRQSAHARQRLSDDWDGRSMQRRIEGAEQGEALLLSLVEPPNTTLDVLIRQDVRTLQRLVQSSTPDSDPIPQIAIVTQLVDAPAEFLDPIRHATLVLLVTAIQDGALLLTLTISVQHTHVQVRLEADRPGLATLRPTHPLRMGLLQVMTHLGGTLTWDTGPEHWISTLTLPQQARMVAG